jgi:methylglyoxal synthase
MKLVRRTFVAAAFAAVLPLVAHAADIREHTIKFAFQNPKEHPQGQGAQKFADLVAQKSGGKIQVKLYPSGQLGGDVQTVSAMQGGTIEMTVLNAGILQSQVKEFAVYDFPFLFNNAQEADAVTDGSFGKNLFAKLEPKGLVGLNYWDLGFRNLTNSKRPIAKAEALAQQCQGAGPIRGCSLRDLEGLGFDIVLNATSASLTGELPAVPASVFSQAQLAYELAYAKGLTPFLRLAQGAGVQRLADGVGMLVEQAAEAFQWWREVRPDTAPLIRQLTVPLV